MHQFANYIFYKGSKKVCFDSKCSKMKARDLIPGVLSLESMQYAETHAQLPWRRTINRSSKQKTSLPVPHPTVKSLFGIVYAIALLTLKPRWAATHISSACVWILEITLCVNSKTRPSKVQVIVICIPLGLNMKLKAGLGPVLQCQMSALLMISSASGRLNK